MGSLSKRTVAGWQRFGSWCAATNTAGRRGCFGRVETGETSDGLPTTSQETHKDLGRNARPHRLTARPGKSRTWFFVPVMPPGAGAGRNSPAAPSPTMGGTGDSRGALYGAAFAPQAIATHPQEASAAPSPTATPQQSRVGCWLVHTNTF